MAQEEKNDQELLKLIRRVSANIAKLGLVESETQKVDDPNGEKFFEVYSNSYSSLIPR